MRTSFLSTYGAAARVISYLKRKGLSVPGDLSIVSFDNSAYSEMSAPRITSLSHGRCNVGRMDGVTLEGFIAFEGRVEHKVGIRCRKAIDVDGDFEQSRHFADQAFEPCFDVRFDGGFLFRAELILELP